MGELYGGGLWQLETPMKTPNEQGRGIILQWVKIYGTTIFTALAP